MTDQRRKRPRDTNQLAKFIVDMATGETDDSATTNDHSGKSSAAVELGRKGGNARAQSMSKERRSQIAKKAASVRWAARHSSKD